MRTLKMALFLLVGFMAGFMASVPTHAEYANYGRIELNGLAKESWPLNPTIRYSNGMVCNVNGPDGFVTVRACPSTSCKSKRKLNRLAIIEVDKYQRKGSWIKVTTANRTHSKNGKPIEYKSLHVTGWVHTNYLCDFIDY